MLECCTLSAALFFGMFAHYILNIAKGVWLFFQENVFRLPSKRKVESIYLLASLILLASHAFMPNYVNHLRWSVTNTLRIVNYLKQVATWTSVQNCMSLSFCLGLCVHHVCLHTYIYITLFFFCIMQISYYLSSH